MPMTNLFDMLANTADGAFVIDEEQTIIFWNDTAHELLGYTADEAVGKPCYELLKSCNDKGQMICCHHCYIVMASLAGDAIANYDAATSAKSGQIVWINVSIMTVPSSDEDPTPVIIYLFRDATHKKENEQLLNQILEVARRVPETDTQTISPVLAKVASGILTEREYELLSLLSKGADTQQIAKSLSISPATVRNHIQNILNKLNVHSRLEAVVYAFKNGLVSGK